MKRHPQLTVLVVDDDPTIRRALDRILSADERLQVVQAEDGLAGLRVLESQHIDIVISDESMPHINGVRLLQTVRARWPGTRRVLYTGHPHADVVLAAINRGGVDKALMKGVPIEQLRMEIGEVVDECFAQVLGGEVGSEPAAVPASDDGEREASRVRVLAGELAVATAYQASLVERGFEAQVSTDPDEALRQLREARADVIVVDLSRPELDVSAFLRGLRAFDLDCPVVITTSRGEVSRAIEAIRDGAYRYLVHPVRGETLATVVRQAALLGRVAELRRRALSDADEQAAWQVGDRVALEVRFRQALEKLFMVYQPIVSYSDRRVIGYEALVRSEEPTLPHPGALFDAAARLDRTEELSRRIRFISPQPYLNARSRLPDDLFLFMNVNVKDLDEPDFVEGPLAKMAGVVALEMTERAALDSLDDVAARVSELRARGYGIAVDDLGAGYAGLSSFALLEPDIVKVDMSLIRNIHLAPLKQRLIAGLADACADLGVWLIAEGVETVEERDTLLKLNVNLFQGFLFARPARELLPPNWG